MATIKRSTLDSYTKALKRITDENQRTMRKALEGIDLAAADETAYKAATAAIRAITRRSTAEVEIVSGSFYDGVRFDALGKVSGIVPMADSQVDAADAAARGIIAKYSQKGETTEQIADRLIGRIDYDVKKTAASVVQNMGRMEPRSLRKKLRYARVPSGSDTCDFCMMLASRGPVYINASRAGQNGNHYHADCDCRIVPMWDSTKMANGRRRPGTSVEGYDPEALYKRYQESELGKRYQLEQVKKAGTASEKLIADWTDGIDKATGYGGTYAYEATEEQKRVIKDTFAASEYSWMLDQDFESLIKGSYMSTDPMRRRAYHTAMAFVEPEWDRNR